MLLFRFVTFIVHALIFFLRFSQKQKCKPAKKIQGNVLLHNWKVRAKNSGAFEGKNILPEKVTYIHLAQCFIHKVVQHKKFPKERIWGAHHLPYYILFPVNFLKIVLERRVRHNYANFCPKLLHVTTYVLLVYNFCPWQRLVQINITSIHRSAIQAERFVPL